jgi:hypothetical protein
MAIYLGPWLPKASSDLTRSAFALGQCPRYKFEWALLTPPTAEGGTYSVLLRVGFTKLPRSLGVLVSSYLTFSPLSRLSPCTPCGAGLSSGRYLFCGTFLILERCVAAFKDSPRYGPPCPAELGLSSPPDRLRRKPSGGAAICFPSTPFLA